MFGTQFVGAIHGRLLTAWSTAGIIGPVVVNYIREAQLAAGVPRAHLYDYTLYILAGMLVVGLICNWLVKPVDPKWYMSPEEVAKLQAATRRAARRRARSGSARAASIGRPQHSGPSSEFRWPGAYGSRWNRRRRSCSKRLVPHKCERRGRKAAPFLFAVFRTRWLRHLLLQMREHRVECFGVHLGLELVAVLQARGLLRGGTGVDLVDQTLEILVLVPGALADHVR